MRLLNSSFIYDLGLYLPIVNNFRQPQSPPVSQGQEVDVLVESVGDKGDGVAKVKGFVVFIPGTSKGEAIRIRIKKVMKSVAFGEKIGEAQSKPEASHAPRGHVPKEEEIDFEALGEGTEDFGEDLEEE